MLNLHLHCPFPSGAKSQQIANIKFPTICTSFLGHNLVPTKWGRKL
jgi:hypothetical protein